MLCVGKMGKDPIAAWKSKIKWYSENNHFKDMNRIDGMSTEFEWKICPAITTLGLLEKIQSLMRDLQCEPEHSKRQDHLHVNVHRHCMGRKKEIQKYVNATHRQLRNMLVNSRAVIGLSWGLDQERNGAEAYTDKPDGSWDRMAEDMMMNFTDSGHPIFRASSAFERGDLRPTRFSKLTIFIPKCSAVCCTSFSMCFCRCRTG